MISTIRHRLKILQGSLDAGNEGTYIYKECIDLLDKLHEYSDISNYDYFRLKKELKSI